jgi:hypothetical protein
MRLRSLVLGSLVLLIVFVLHQTVQPLFAAGVVGTGSPDSCTESALDGALIGGGNISFNCGTNPVVIPIFKEKVIAQNTVIDGGGLVTISGRHATRVFKVNAGVTFEVRKLIIAHGAANDTSETARDGNGAGIFNDGGAVTLIDSTVKAGRADHSGGGIYNKNGSLTLIRATISDNAVSDNGAAILNENGTVLVGNSTLSGNLAGKNGGGLFNFAGTATLINSTLHNNNAGFNGSGILNNQEGTVNRQELDHCQYTFGLWAVDRQLRRRDRGRQQEPSVP